MTIELTIKELVASRTAFIALLQEKITPKAAFLVSLVQKKIEPELKTFDERNNELIERLGKEGKRGKEITPDNKEAMSAYNNEMSPILETKVNINVDPIDIGILGQKEITGGIISLLSWLFVIPKEEGE